MSSSRTIKRYSNRKLYDTERSCYITLDEIAAMVRQGEEVIIVDNKTKEDITALTMAQILAEEEKKFPKMPLKLLQSLIQNGKIDINTLYQKVERRLAGLMEDDSDDPEAPPENPKSGSTTPSTPTAPSVSVAVQSSVSATSSSSINTQTQTDASTAVQNHATAASYSNQTVSLSPNPVAGIPTGIHTNPNMPAPSASVPVEAFTIMQAEMFALRARVAHLEQRLAFLEHYIVQSSVVHNTIPTQTQSHIPTHPASNMTGNMAGNMTGNMMGNVTGNMVTGVPASVMASSNPQNLQNIPMTTAQMVGSVVAPPHSAMPAHLLHGVAPTGIPNPLPKKN